MSDDEQPRLPPGLDLLWGRRRRSRKGPKPGLTLDAVVDAAISIADAEGLDAVSMARVAEELGYTAMSLYRYVGGKAELLQLMWNSSAAGAPEITGADWRSRLESWARAQRDMLSHRTWILELPMATPPAGPNSLAWLEQAMAALDGTGLTAGEQLGALGLISSYTLAEARMAHDAASAAGDGEPPIDYGALLRLVADEAEYPHLHRAAWSGELGDPQGDGEEQSFTFGLERILDGIQALIDQRARDARAESGRDRGQRRRRRAAPSA